MALLLGLALLWATGGYFTYCLDDPYIHLALAENLPFNYSINAPGDEAGAPSSSILYPYLLMPLAHTKLAFLAPLLLNLVGAALMVALLLRLSTQVGLGHLPPRQRGLLVAAFALLINTFALIYTGMEHTLQVAAALAVFSGLLRIAAEEKPDRWFWLAILIGPLLRYEMLALSTAALVYAGVYGYARRSVVVFFAMLVGPVLFSFYLHSMGYAWLPSSVLSKSAPLTTASEGMSWLTSLVVLLFNAFTNFVDATTWSHFAQVLLLSVCVLTAKVTRRQRGVILVVLFTALAHQLLGKFGWWGRYNAYLLALDFLTLVYAWKNLWARPALRFAGAAICILLCGSSLYYTAATPLAARQVYLYHATLHDFLVEQWRDKAAAYDIGYMAWHNPYAIVDLFGLGSEPIRRLIRHPEAAVVIPAYLKANHVGLIIAEDTIRKYYQSPDWRIVGELKVDSPRLVTGLVPQFYATDPALVPELRSKLEAFRASLPPGVTLQLY